MIHPESGEARKATAGAMSCGWPMRPSGIEAVMAENPSIMPDERVPSVSTGPGLIELTRILRGPSSFAKVRVRLSTADLVAL